VIWIIELGWNNYVLCQMKVGRSSRKYYLDVTFASFLSIQHFVGDLSVCKLPYFPQSHRLVFKRYWLLIKTKWLRLIGQLNCTSQVLLVPTQWGDGLNGIPPKWFQALAWSNIMVFSATFNNTWDGECQISLPPNLQLFVGVRMSYLRDTLCCQFLWIVHFLFTPSALSSV
jgi:hypothetical protein